jgi:hypothetical protein
MKAGVVFSSDNANVHNMAGKTTINSLAYNFIHHLILNMAVGG